MAAVHCAWALSLLHLISPTPRVLLRVTSQINCELESLSQGLPLEQSNLEQGTLPTEVCTRQHSVCPFFWPGSLPAYELHKERASGTHGIITLLKDGALPHPRLFFA